MLPWPPTITEREPLRPFGSPAVPPLNTAEPSVISLIALAGCPAMKLGLTTCGAIRNAGWLLTRSVNGVLSVVPRKLTAGSVPPLPPRSHAGKPPPVPEMVRVFPAVASEMFGPAARVSISVSPFTDRTTAPSAISSAVTAAGARAAVSMLAGATRAA